MKNVFLVIFCIVLSMSQVHAGLIQRDAFDAGDELAVKEQSTGIVWLDLSLTVGLDCNITADLYSDWELADISDHC